MMGDGRTATTLIDDDLFPRRSFALEPELLLWPTGYFRIALTKLCTINRDKCVARGASSPKNSKKQKTFESNYDDDDDGCSLSPDPTL